jgi:hypothetical protein
VWDTLARTVRPRRARRPCRRGHIR